MANIFGTPRAGGPAGPDEFRTVPTGDTVGTYTSYLDAQKAVDYLADQQFPVQMVSIVGNDLKMVERVTGRLSYPRVALSGALSGMWFGLFVGVLLSFFSTSPGYFSIMTSVLMGAAFFMLFGIVTYAMQRGKRDFTSTSQVVATSYNVVVSPEAAHEARRLLQQLPMNSADAGGNRPYPAQPWQQPGQQPWQQPGQAPGQAPERPSGWADPYGQQQGQPQAQQPPAGAVPAGEPQQPAQQPRSAVRYPDLPDGRPQYGIRVTEDKPAEEHGKPQSDAREGSEGNGDGTPRQQ
ncbi:general stress protein [Pseudarthrobacter sp. J75]|uniref:general stress protein n=1 Tax=unclassified Pseudarthrobacter TaxID=2647000 RepID=UPI002E80CD7E|nr:MULTISPECIES: general stress protein [unclassified Pseudarthrobacter]MEE2521304.1 general stress protein [Pseudarthrobacter sp. J47]MEE2528536.1 general stress protein [Pseudarthrobacter sp. J75]